MTEPTRVVMMGTGTFARPTLEALLAEPAVEAVGLVTQPDRDAGQQRGSTRQTGASLKEIAVSRNTSPYTVANQLRSIYAKLGVSNRLELIARCGSK